MKSIINDGANWQAQAVAAYLGWMEIECSRDAEKDVYLAQPEINRWHNCREQGYVISLVVNYGPQLNIIFFEHRNSNRICAVVWEQKTLNPPNIDTAKFGNIYKDKFDYSHSVGYGKIVEMGDWILNCLSEFYTEKSKPVDKGTD